MDTLSGTGIRRLPWARVLPNLEPGDGGVHRVGSQYAVESFMNSTLTSKGYKGVRLGQVSLFLPGWFIIAYKWLSGGARVSEHGAAACPDLDTVL